MIWMVLYVIGSMITAAVLQRSFRGHGKEAFKEIALLSLAWPLLGILVLFWWLFSWLPERFSERKEEKKL